MKLRNLQASDLFGMVRILNGIGLSRIKSAIDFDKIKEARKNMTEENSAEISKQVGTEIILSVIGVIIENLPTVETEIYKFIGGVANMKPAEVAKLDASAFVDLLLDIFKKEEFLDFFSRASKLIK